MEWDYIIVGAGSAGCAVAHQLVKDGKRVLVLEAGGSDRSPRLRIPAGLWHIGAKHDWGYSSQPDPTRNGVVEGWQRGRVLGGSSSINGMVYVRGAAGDFDRWMQHSGPEGGWSAREILPIFREIESSDQVSPLRGRSGPLHVRTVKRAHAVTDAFIESACALGYPFNSDYNGTSQGGVGYVQYTQHRGFRWSAADAFLKPILHRKNLQLRLNVEVEKIEVANGRARAVVFRYKGRRCREVASHIVLSAGAINTPKLLMLSGIGDAEELRRHKIGVVLDLPAVGQNLREHAAVVLRYRSKVQTYNLTGGLWQKLTLAAKYALFHEGPIAAAYEAAAFLKINPSAPIPEVQVLFAPIGWQWVEGARQLAPYPALSVTMIRSHSVSGGRIHLASEDPGAAPLIECKLLDSQADVDTLVGGIEAVRAIMRTQPLANMIDTETSPGTAFTGTDSLREYVRSRTVPCCHPMGTCRMGSGTESVVGPDLRVHGTDNLWIADASVMPDAISAQLNAVCMMIGAKLGKQLTQQASSRCTAAEGA